MTVAIVLLGIGLVPLNPNVATVMVLAAFVVALVGLLVSRARAFVVDGSTLVRVMVAGIIVEGLVLASLPVFQEVGYRVSLVVLALVAAHATLVASRWRWAEVAFALGGHFLVTCWMLASTEVPPIDVILFQQEGSAALIRGVNPFDMRFENIYFGLGTDYYSPELLVGDELAFGFIYPPLSLLLAVPGYVIAGDYRYGAAAAITITVGLVALARPGRVATGAAMLILFAPVTQVVLYWGWTEPFVVVMLAATVFLAVRSSASSLVALGLLIAVKQYCAPILLIGFVLLRALRRSVGPVRMLLVPLGVALATAIPFAIWNLPALLHSTVTVHFIQPFRIDALAVPAQLARAGLEPTPAVLGFLLGVVALGLLVARVPRTVAGLSYATALTLMVFFLFSKQAFLHYYFFVLVALACGIATTAAGSVEGGGGRSPAAG
jgi:hypothetical protein